MLVLGVDGRVTTSVCAPQQLPPHVLREMYSSHGQDSRLYGGRMTTKRLEIVSSITAEAIESLHK